MGCKFCHLTPYKDVAEGVSAREIVEAVGDIYDELKLGKNPKPLLISFMGAGEPLTNIGDLYVTMIHLRGGFQELPVRFAFSTMLPCSHMQEFMSLGKQVKLAELPVKAYLSLHFTDNEVRREWMPASLDIRSSLSLLEWWKHYTGNPVEIHYTLIDGLTDSVDSARKLGSWLYGRDIPVTLLHFNSKDGQFKASTSANRTHFENALRAYDIDFKYYIAPGGDIGASCGQFDVSVYKQAQK
jgi:23S rRNA (adenine2503-C2)-methyltransferase